MSALQSQELERAISLLTPTLSKNTVLVLVSQVVWLAFDALQDQSIKLKLFGVIPISVPVRKLAPLIEQLAGPRPQSK